MPQPQKFYVIACHVLWRELCYYAALSPHVFDFKFLKQGLHNTPVILRQDVQKAIDDAPEDCSAILIGYGLCSNGIEGIVARRTRLVVMRGHDCITYLLGSKERYREYFDQHPGTYWYSPGWIDQGDMPGKGRQENTYRSYVETYGEENAQYLIEMERKWVANYTSAAYVDLGFGDSAPHNAFTKECAAYLGWDYAELAGDPGLIQNFVEGNWDPEAFLIVEPGETIVASHDALVLAAKPRE